MNKYIATVIDTTGIQRYIFGSNRLKENVGASYLVKSATDKWVEEILKSLDSLSPENIHIPDKSKQEFNPLIHDNESIMAELIYAGGGNTVLVFRKVEQIDYAKEFTRKLSFKILNEAPGLNIVVAHQEFDWNEKLLREVIDDEIKKNKLDTQKREARTSSPVLGLGVTASCISTGLVAVEMRDIDGEPKPISREIVAKTNDNTVKGANEELKKIIFDSDKLARFKIPLDVDDLGRTEQESSYMAIVHIDGNQMGKRFEDYSKSQDQENKSEANKNYIIAMRKLSWGVNEAAIKSLKAVVELLIDSIVKEKFSIKNKFLPFRPIVYGGDDVTFICDGRLGLALAIKFLKEFEKHTENLPNAKGGTSKATACAGIAIVKTHYPFARAYQLSEALCKSAKNFVSEKIDNPSKKEPIFSALDWHIASSGILGTIDQIREREYKARNGEKLTIRPMRSHEYGSDWLTWTDFAEVIRQFKEEEPWKDKRNKVKALREVLREGKTATEQFLKAYGDDDLPIFIKANNQLKQCGWIDGACGYFDAIEAMDFYISLED
ncbi:Cas10/Cmr2 second palm domain-containing protein [Anabaena azotica]|uniref:Cas10/Cmr2 second palm domain-containing protein n=1 Tax=Anabaena azotica FACHB-119 TaxID=947527 RepID=A0ABR8CXR3_9NOST|nr:hypothetical protein [Anabaena azotica]MBD2499497.1 hypothetical protein [Anabaena azotica FACHB-119]